MLLEIFHKSTVRFGELRVIREGWGQPCRTETLGHGWYAIAIAIGLMLYYHSIAIVDRFVVINLVSRLQLVSLAVTIQ